MEDSVKLEIGKEKSIFERAIIESFKQNKISDIYEKLLIAYEELPIYIEEIKKGNEQEKKNNFILNYNILDKISRLIERNYININILISKIFIIILKEDNLPLLSDNSMILVNLSNKLIRILEILKSCDNYYDLAKSSINYMKYLSKNSEKFLSDEQPEIINNLQSSLKEKITSPIYVKFKNSFADDINLLIKGESAEEKEKCLDNLIYYFYKLNTLNEQFELLNNYGDQIIKGIIYKPNPSYIEIYSKFSEFFISFLYNFTYKIVLAPNENEIKNVDNNEKFYILDSMEENIELAENLYVTKYKGYEYNNMKFLDKSFYELDNYKDILLKNNKIFSLFTSFLNCLILFEESFKIQYICFTFLKRLYFIFPKHRNELEDLISTSLINLICFNTEITVEKTELIESFLIYLLQSGEENIKTKIKDRITQKKDKIKKDYTNLINEGKIEKLNVKSETIYLSDFDLQIGCPINVEVTAGDEEEKLIEVKNPNSLLYLEICLPYYDINLHLIKYCPNINKALPSKEEKKEYEDYQYFYEIFKLEKCKCTKIIVFIKSPGLYKILFDNKYSWFHSKTIRYSCIILKELSGLNMSPSVSNEEIKFDSGNNEKDEKKEENNSNIINNVGENNINEGENNIVDDDSKKVEKIDVKLGDNPNENEENLNNADENLK